MVPIVIAAIASFTGLLGAGAALSRKQHDENGAPVKGRSKLRRFLFSVSGERSTRASVAPAATPAPRHLPPEVAEALTLLEGGKASEAVVRRAADLADVAGHVALSDELEERADTLRLISDLAGPDDNDQHTSPIHEATDEQWTALVDALATGTPGEVNPDGTLGRWCIGYRQLRDLGLVEETKMRDPYISLTWRWKLDETGRSVPFEEAQAAFLADEGAQYMALAQVLAHHYQALIGDEHKLLGREVDGRALSLSGLLGLARKAGLSGLHKWIASPADRAKFSRTTAFVDLCNGIF